MSGILIALGGYLAVGTLILIIDGYKSTLSYISWGVGTGGFIWALLSYLQSGPLIWYLGGWNVKGIEVRLDLTSLLFMGLILSLNLVTLLHLKSSESKSFYSLYNYLLGMGTSLAITHDIFNLYVCIELLSVVTILLIGYERKTHQIWAGIKYLFLSSLSMSIYLLGMSLLYKAAGTLSISELTAILSQRNLPTVNIGLALMVAGLAVKGGIFFFGMWLPDAHAYSHHVVSVLLSGMAIKGGIMGIIRISSVSDLTPVLTTLGAVTGIGGVIYAMFATKPKRILAFSTMSQMGYILVGLGSGTITGIVGGTFHLLFHGLFKGLLFLSVGFSGVGEENIYEISDRKVPLMSKVGFLIGSLSIAGVPPLNGFISKTLCVEGFPSLWVSGLLFLVGIGTAISFIRLGWFFLGGKTIWEFKSGTAILLLSAIVLASGFLTGGLVGEVNWAELLKPLPILESLVTLGVGGLLYFLLKDHLHQARIPRNLFNIDNSILSIFLGFIAIISLLIYL